MPQHAEATVVDTLHLVLEHLGGSDGNQQQYNTAARGLHRASRECQAAARATLRQLRLDRYYDGLVIAYPDPDQRPAAIPLELVSACPADSSWVVHIQQLECFGPDMDPQLAAAASRLKRLVVTRQDNSVENTEDDNRPWRIHPQIADTQLQGLGRLLWAATGLEDVQFPFLDMPKPWLALDPDSSSLSTATAPPLPLRCWSSWDGAEDILYGCVAQHAEQLGQTLWEADIRGGAAGTRLTPLTNLRSLKLHTNCVDAAALATLSGMTRLTRLQLPACEEAMEVACGLPILHHLCLEHFSSSSSGWAAGPLADLQALPSTLCCLQQLTCLKVCATKNMEVQEGLGRWLPRLERLEATGHVLPSVPASLTRLTGLHMSGSGSGHLHLPTALTTLRQLCVYSVQSIKGLNHLTGLQVLHVDTYALGCSLASLAPLTSLMVLELATGWSVDPASFTVLGGLQQLTNLGLREFPSKIMASVPWGLLQPLPALQVLDMWREDGDRISMTPAGPWLVQLTALSKLTMPNTTLADGDELLYLPTGLLELDINGTQQMPQLPRGLQRLSALTSLDIHSNDSLSQLPEWLSELRCLEALHVCDTGVVTEQPVLARMPALRCVKVRGCPCYPPDGEVPEAAVYGQATHLFCGDISQFPELW